MGSSRTFKDEGAVFGSRVQEMTVGTGDCVKDFKRFQLQYGVQEFCNRFNHPFLVFDEQKNVAEAEQRSFNTMHLSRSELMQFLKAPSGRNASSRVLKLVKPGTATFQDMLKVGRAGNCDVVLNSPAISKFHAYFSKENQGTRYFLCDVGSTNGTYVNNVKLKPNDRKTLSNGDSISFSRQIHFLFYTPEGCYDLLKTIPA